MKVFLFLRDKKITNPCLGYLREEHKCYTIEMLQKKFRLCNHKQSPYIKGENYDE